MRIDSGYGWRRMAPTTLVTLALAAALAATGLTSAGATVSSVRMDLVANVAPVPNFNNSGYSRTAPGGLTKYPNPCVRADQGGQPVFIVNARSVACTSYVLQAIDRARRLEGVRPMVLPTNWYRLSTTQQLLVVTDLERVDRGLPPYLGLNSALNSTAQVAAGETRDPGVAPRFKWAAMGATWASAGSVLEADYGWLYEDGWAGSISATSNYDCTSATAPGCWGHRHVLLGRYTGVGCAICELGTGFASVNRYGGSYTVLVERPAGPPPAMSFTWARNVLPYLKGTTSTAAASATPTTTASKGGTSSPGGAPTA